MTKQGARGDHFLAFLILNAAASGFNTPRPDARGQRPGGSGARTRISSRGNDHVIYCCRGGSTGGRVRGGGYKMTEEPALQPFGAAARCRPPRWNQLERAGPGDWSVTLYFENTL